MKLFIAIVIGLLLGGVVSKFLFVGSSLNLLPWGVAGLLIGYFARSRKEAVVNAAVYGFVLSFTFMVVGYAGKAPILIRIPFFTILGLIGAACGGVLGCIASFSPHKNDKIK